MAKENRRGSDILNQLGIAQRKIATLEDFIRDRERQLHAAVSRSRLDRRDSYSRPGDSRFARVRRVGLSSDLLRMHSASRDEEPVEDPGMSSAPPPSPTPAFCAAARMYIFTILLYAFISCQTSFFIL